MIPIIMNLHFGSCNQAGIIVIEVLMKLITGIDSTLNTIAFATHPIRMFHVGIFEINFAMLRGSYKPYPSL